MQSPNRAYLFEADQLRGIAALLVFFYHSMHSGRAALSGVWDWPRAISPFDALLWEGHTGVALFMVLSGFILARGTFGSEISYSGFIKNRVLRIFPLVIVVSVFAAYGTTGASIENFLAPFLLLANTGHFLSPKADWLGQYGPQQSSFSST